LEIAFDRHSADVARHNSGLALRLSAHPRIRTDKSVAEIDTVAAGAAPGRRVRRNRFLHSPRKSAGKPEAALHKRFAPARRAP
jgi:hypothetical protein